MGFAWDIEIIANTSERIPKKQKLKLTDGVITKIEIYFPPGCHGLVKVRLTRGGVFRIIPLSPDEWISGDNGPVAFRTYWVIDDTPRYLDFTACSPDTSYNHTITVRLELLPKQIATMAPFIDVMSKFLRKIGVM